jgi:hypothetical protein
LAAGAIVGLIILFAIGTADSFFGKSWGVNAQGSLAYTAWDRAKLNLQMDVNLQRECF